LVSAPQELGPHHPLGPAERDALRALQAAKDWPAAYRQIAAYADQNKKITPQVANWLRTAADINQNIGPYAAYVRSEGVFAWARKGEVLTPEKFQKVSDELGASVVEHVLRYGVPERANAVLAEDVKKAVERFGLKPHEWAGATANGLTSFDTIAPKYLNHFFMLPPSLQMDSFLPLGEWGKQGFSQMFDLPYVDIGLYEGQMFGEPSDQDGINISDLNPVLKIASILWDRLRRDKNPSQTSDQPPAADGTDVRPADAQWGAAWRWLMEALHQSQAANLQKQMRPLGDKAAYLHPYYERTERGRQFVPGQLWSPLLHTLMPGVRLDEMTEVDKKNWEAFKTILVQHPEIAQAYGLGAVKPEGAAQSYLVSDEARTFINLMEVTTLTPEEATRRKQMAAIWAKREEQSPERANPPPVFTLPPLPFDPAPAPGPKDGFREGRAAGPRPVLAFDFPTPPTFQLPALPSKEQIGIDLAFSPPPTLVDEGDGPRRVPQRIAPPPPPAPDDAPITLKQFQEAQDALLLDLRVTLMNRPAPEIDVHALRKKLAREAELDARCGRTIRSYPR
jgi:hypothetical protein